MPDYVAQDESAILFTPEVAQLIMSYLPREPSLEVRLVCHGMNAAVPVSLVTSTLQGGSIGLVFGLLLHDAHYLPMVPEVVYSMLCVVSFLFILLGSNNTTSGPDEITAFATMMYWLITCPPVWAVTGAIGAWTWTKKTGRPVFRTTRPADFLSLGFPVFQLEKRLCPRPSPAALALLRARAVAKRCYWWAQLRRQELIATARYFGTTALLLAVASPILRIQYRHAHGRAQQVAESEERVSPMQVMMGQVYYWGTTRVDEDGNLYKSTP
eukprot:gene6225-1110_t